MTRSHTHNTDCAYRAKPERSEGQRLACSASILEIDYFSVCSRVFVCCLRTTMISRRRMAKWARLRVPAALPQALPRRLAPTAHWPRDSTTIQTSTAKGSQRRTEKRRTTNTRSAAYSSLAEETSIGARLASAVTRSPVLRSPLHFLSSRRCCCSCFQ